MPILDINNSIVYIKNKNFFLNGSLWWHLTSENAVTDIKKYSVY